MSLWLVFLTGLTTGGVSCAAVQSGLLASLIANQKKREQGELTVSSEEYPDWLPVFLFLLTKLVSHVMIGAVLGGIGGYLQLSPTLQLSFQAFAVLFMLASAANLLEVHPVFRWVAIQPPHWLTKKVRQSTKAQAVFAPALLGFLTVLIPCGVTQAMMVAAISSGSAITGAMILGVFVIGTAPVFGLIGMATAKLSEQFQHTFLKIAAVALVLLALSNFNGILVVLNAPITWQKIMHPITYLFSEERFAHRVVPVRDGVPQKVTIRVTSHGYTPQRFSVYAGVPVELTVQSDGVYSCASAFRFPAFGIKLELTPTDQQVVTFTPTEKGIFQFSCSMGMYGGIMEVL